MFSDILGAKDLEDMRSRPAEEVFAACDAFMEKAAPLAKGLFLVPNIDGKVLTKGYYETIEACEIKKIPYMLGCTKNDIGAEPGNQATENTLLHRGCVAFSQKLEELGLQPAYVYHFDRDLPGDAQGAWHSAELWYTFGTLKRCWRPWEKEDDALSHQMLDQWANFMRNGDPNGEGLPEWRPCTKEDPFIMKLDV